MAFRSRWFSVFLLAAVLLLVLLSHQWRCETCFSCFELEEPSSRRTLPGAKNGKLSEVPRRLKKILRRKQETGPGNISSMIVVSERDALPYLHRSVIVDAARENLPTWNDVMEEIPSVKDNRVPFNDAPPPQNYVRSSGFMIPKPASSVQNERKTLLARLANKPLLFRSESEIAASPQNDAISANKHNASEFTSASTLGEPGVVLDCISWDEKSRHDPRALTLKDFASSSLHLAQGEGSARRKEFFRTIFQRRDWPAPNDTSYWGLQASGPGASIRNAQGAIAALHSVISHVKAHLNKSRISVLDVPCGDLQWMGRFLDTRWDLEYVGADVVPELIASHRKNFRRMSNARFIQLDVVSEPLDGAYDLILCRDMLQHLWRADAAAALRTFSSSGSAFLLATTFRDTTRNDEVEREELGARRSPYNLELAPFSLEPPVCLSYDWNVEHLGLWRLPLRRKV